MNTAVLEFYSKYVLKFHIMPIKIFMQNIQTLRLVGFRFRVHFLNTYVGY